MFYLRKITNNKTPDGRNFTVDSAIYKDDVLDRFYRDYYPKPHNEGIHLYQSNNFNEILHHRDFLKQMNAGIFDIYNENGKVK